METKTELIAYINMTYGGKLSNLNTSYSKINKSKEVWWFNIHVSKFVDDVNLLLQGHDRVYWLLLPKGFVNGIPFKIREDKNAVDLEISADRSFKFLHDVKSGGTGFDFRSFVKEEIQF